MDEPPQQASGTVSGSAALSGTVAGAASGAAQASGTATLSPAAGAEAGRLTPSLANLVERSGVRPFGTPELIEALLADHGGYGFDGSVAWPERSRRQPVPDWLASVRSLLKPGTHDPLHGRAAILGACLLDLPACRAAVEAGLFWRLASDLEEPLFPSLEEAGLRLLEQSPLAAVIAGRPLEHLFRIDHLGGAAEVRAVDYAADGTLGAVSDPSEAPTFTEVRGGTTRQWTASETAAVGPTEDRLRARLDGIQITPDGRQSIRLVEGRVRLRAREEGTDRDLPVPVVGEHIALAISDDGRTVAVGDSGLVTVWETGNLTEIDRIPIEGGRPVLALAPRGAILALAIETTVRIGVDRFTVPDQVTALAWSPDGLLLAAATWSGHVTLWASRSRRVIAEVELGSKATSLAFSPDGRTLAVGGVGVVHGIDVHLGRTRLATGYDSDSATDQRYGDLLDIDPDVEALASVIAARAVVPPLSIGLFGEWGLGKSFFMRRLRDRVWDIAREARESGQVQQEVDFYKYVAQIEFNAWQYVEGNLWASLVQHIFSNLRIQSEDPERRDRGDLLLRDAGESVRRASAAVERAQARQQEAMRKVASIKAKLAAEEQRLQDIARRQAVGVALSGDALAKAREGLSPLGLDRAWSSTEEALGSLREGRDVLRRWLPTLRLVLDGKQPGARTMRLRLAAAALAGPLVALAVALVVYLAGSGALAGISGAAAGISAALVGLATWVRRQSKWASGLLRQIDDATEVIVRDMAAVQGDLARERAEAEQELARTNTELGAALRAREEAKEGLASAEIEHHRPTTELLARYIQDRADSDDYRKHLGLVALVHQDFERLSERVGRAVEWLDANENLATEVAQSKGRVDRIVLYIDDLDRCPPRRVVEVLEAVHLLLAFPLFVVVVGVDSRWVFQSLRAHYAKLLRGDRSPLMATPLDYVEKIFQVPYQLRPLDPGATRSMLDGLLGRTDPTSAPTQAQAVAELPDMAPAAPAPANGSTPSTPIAEAGRPPPRDLRPASLRITPEERAVMDELAPLLGRTPRTVKRFLNVYRILKVRAQDRPRFLEDAGPTSEFRLTMFLLAVASGLPDLATHLLHALSTAPDELRLDQLTVTGPKMSLAAVEEQQRLELWLDEAGPDWKELRVEDLRPVADDVRRFTFVVDPY